MYHDSGYLASKDMTDLMETSVELVADATGGYGPGYIGSGGGFKDKAATCSDTSVVEIRPP